MSSSVAATATHFAAETRLQRRLRAAKTRKVAWGEIVAVVMIAIMLVVAAVTTSSRVTGNLPSERVRVESGQTLWALATAHPIAGFTTQQTAELIASANGLRTSQLVAGTTISIPAKPHGALTVACR